MKIGIISSGSEMLTLFAFLTKYDHEYVIYYDDLHRPYGDKTFDQSLEFVKQGMAYLKKQDVDAIILPPIYELYFLAGNATSKTTHQTILPLFTTYVLEYCFNHSLVGKIGVCGDFADIEKAQLFLHNLEKRYALNSHQKSVRAFHSPFVYWTKEFPLRKYYLTNLSYSHILVNKIIKFDLRYFKDAMVDTLIPFNYGYFHYQPTITKFLNFKKIRFHKLEKLEHCFQQLIGSLKPEAGNRYSVTIAYTGHTELLKREKRVMWLLQRGKNIDIQRKKI